MKLDKKSLIEYDYKNYLKKYNELQNGIKNNRKVDNLNIKDMKTWIREGVFCRKLKFQKNETNFYITTASISRGIGYSHDVQFTKDSYIIPYWRDKLRQAQKLMKFEIKDESPANGKLELVGDFKPFEDNLLDIKYKTIAGKEYIKNAKDFLSDKGVSYNENEKIDIENFFRLKFKMAEQGLQARALYDENNCIIDGSAGTGKSTIAIQKLKYFYENGIKEEKMLLIIKNESLRGHFYTLLKDENINLQNLKINTTEEAFDINELNNVQQLINEAGEIRKKLDTFIQQKDVEYLQKHYYNLFNHIGLEFFQTQIKQLLKDLQQKKYLIQLKELYSKKETLQKTYNDYVIEQKDYIKNLKNDLITLQEKKKSNSISETELDELNEEYNMIDEEVKNYEIKLSNSKTDIKKIQNLIDKYEGKQYRKTLENLNKKNVLSLNILTDIINNALQNNNNLEQLEALKWIIEYRNYLINYKKNEQKLNALKNLSLSKKVSVEEKDNIHNDIEKLKEELNKKFKNLNSKYLNKYTEVMKSVYFSEKYFQSTNMIKNNLIYKILNIHAKEFNTIVVDEAQDFSKDTLEYIRLHTERIILTGDILQNIQNDLGLKNWNEIYNIEVFKNENGELNIHCLKHNFRQTYQLANASYNYRQLLLGDSMENIGADYFENEKIFNGKEYPKPSLNFLKKDIEFINFIDNKIEHIVKIYIEKMPIIIIYKTEEEKNTYMQNLTDYEIAYKKIDRFADVILLKLNEIKGEEFPIILADMNSFSERELYLIMTRAQFELDLFIRHYDNFNPLIYQLIKKKEEIEFFNLEKNIDIGQINPSKQKQRVQKEEKIIVRSIDNNKQKSNFKEKTQKTQYNLDSIESKEERQAKLEENRNINDNEQNNIPKTKEQIIKHKAETLQNDDELGVNVITDEKQYQKEFIQKVKEDIKDLNSEKQQKIIKKIVIVKKEPKSEKEKKLKEEIKTYLYNTYKGYCQICGFTFRKVADNKNSFEVFNWNDKRVVKQKKSFVATADSLCLCRNCIANIRWGTFEPTFIDELNSMEDFTNKSIDEIKETICKNIEENVVEKFKDDYEWNDIYTLDIKINGKEKNIYMTNEHLLQFITYLKLEEK